MRVCGVDPGERVGWCVLERDPAGGLPRYVDSGAEARADVGRSPPALYDRLAVEVPAGVHSASMKGGPAKVAGIVKGLLVAARVAERLLCFAEVHNVPSAEVGAAAARRLLGVKIGARRGPTCETCSGSGADGGTEPARALREQAAALREHDGRRAKGKRTRRKVLAEIRLRSAAAFPCPDCDGAGELKPPTVDQQVAALLPSVIAGWPERSNVHERDAAAVAWWAMRRA